MNFYTWFYHTDCRVAPLQLWATFDDLALETERFAFFEEGNGYRGLKRFLQIGKTVIFDNHNHALFFWYEKFLEMRKQYAGSEVQGLNVVHLDQHSDRRDNVYVFKPERLTADYSKEVFDFVQEKTEVGNFITPALLSGLIGNYYEIRTEAWFCDFKAPDEYVLDIDLDFWASEMGIDFQKTLSKLQTLIDQASLVTIATSPYFLDQQFAMTLLSQLKFL